VVDRVGYGDGVLFPCGDSHDLVYYFWRASLQASECLPYWLAGRCIGVVVILVVIVVGGGCSCDACGISEGPLHA